VYASIRKYRSSDVPEVARLIDEKGFLSIVGEVPGFSGYYVVDGGDGTVVTVTMTENQDGAEQSAQKASGWISENEDVAALIEGSPEVTNGEVVAQA
jgi:hypothetical protein